MTLWNGRNRKGGCCDVRAMAGMRRNMPLECVGHNGRHPGKAELWDRG